MDSHTIRTALGELQEDPDRKDAWKALTAAVRDRSGDLQLPDALRILSRARRAHGARGEAEAVADLLSLEVDAAKGTPDEVRLLAEQALVLKDDLFDEEGALLAALRILEIVPNEPAAAESVGDSEDKRGRWRELAQTYLDEASTAPDDVYKSSMLMRAAEMELRFAGEDGKLERVTERLEEAFGLDHTNDRAEKMLERLYRRAGRFKDAARILKQLNEATTDADIRFSSAMRLGRLLAGKVGDDASAASVYDSILKQQPGNRDAVTFLSDHYSKTEQWDELVGLFERQIPESEFAKSERVGDMLQLGMLHWKKRDKPADAEAWFERIRKMEPANQGMLAFFRDYTEKLGDPGRFMTVLAAAQRVMPEGADKQSVTQQIARLAEGQKDAQKAIEQYKSLLRQNPDDADSREHLKDLYRKTQGYNALVELLRQQLERTDPSDGPRRLEVLREVADLYRSSIKSDTALVSVLNQILQIDDKDVETVREIIGLYDRLGRARDLLSSQQRLAELVADPIEKAELFRLIARRWLEQFSNVQNATQAFESLLKVSPGDVEACSNLAELYKKRRAWPQLYELYESQLTTLSGAPRLALMTEMAQLAAERLNRGDDAARLYREILTDDPKNMSVLDALERHAERSKDWPTLAEALERRVDVLSDDAARLAVLQKLGTVYAEHVGDHQGAVRAWRRVLSLQPGHQRALRVLRDSYLLAGDFTGLEELYASQNDWEGLAEVLSNTADRAKESKTKIELSYKAAEVYRDRLNQPDRAFRSYERILATDPNDTRAAEALIPLYESDEKWARLPALYELLVDKAKDSDAKLGYLGKLVQIAGERLSDRQAAAAYARRAYEIAPDDAPTLTAFQEAARAAGAWALFVEAVETRAKKVKKKKRRPLELVLAEVYTRELSRIDDAVELYKGLLDNDPTDDVAGPALDAILRREGRRDDLRWLLGLRVENAPSKDEGVRILREWAALEEEAFAEPERARDLYARTLEAAPGDSVALRALPRLLLAAGNAAGAAEVLEKHRGHVDESERTDVETELSELYISRLARPKDALAGAVRVLALSPHDPRAISVLRRLLSNPDTKEQAAQVLATEYAATGDARQEAEALAALLATATPPLERRALYLKLADVQEQKLSSFNAALDVVLRAVREFPADLELWQRAEGLAAASNRPTDLAEAYREALRSELPGDVELALCTQAAQLHEERLGDPMGASPYLERVLVRDPSNERAFTRLKQILTGAERWADLEALYARAAAATTDPVLKTEMLAEVALVCEEIIEEPAKAARYYERILEVDPSHEGALVALDRLYDQQKRYKDLAALLERRLVSAVGEPSLDMKLRLGRIQLDVLHEPAKAAAHVEDVLRERSNDYEARQLAERLLEIGEQRIRAAKMLEAVYEARDEVRDLVRVLEIRLKALDESPGADDEKKELLRRIASLRDERLHDDDGALEALSRYVPLEPLDVEARARLVEIGRRLGAEARVATVLESASERAETPGMRGEILTEVAGIYENQLGNAEKAEATHRKVLELDPDDAELALPAARALERLYTASGAHEKLRDTLRTQIRLEQRAEVRQELEGRLGTLCETVLGDLDGAILAWKARLEEMAGDPAALSALDRLYERTDKHRELVQILEARRDRAEAPAERREFMRRAAGIHSDKLGAASDAIDTWRAILDEFGPSVEALVALEALYSAASRWQDLADAYESHIEIAESEGDRLSLVSRLGDLRRERLADSAGALAAYRQALALDTQHAPTRAALEKLLASDDTGTRREAAEILHPIYEADGDSESLLRVLEVEIACADDPVAKLARLEKAVQVANRDLKDPSRAFDYAVRAVREAAGHVEIRPWLAELESLAAATGRRSEQVTLLREVVSAVFDGDTQVEITLKIATLAREVLKDLVLAREYYEKALELSPDERGTLIALESLYDELGDSPALLHVLERRVEVSQNDAEKKELLFRRARLLADKMSDKTRAIEVYQTILDIDMDPQAVDALESLYGSEERWEDLVGLYERQLDAPRSPAAELRVKIARVAARHLKDAPRAFDELEAALEIDRQHEGAILELERVLATDEDPEQRARAATLLEPIYLVRSDYDRVMTCISARLEASGDPDRRRELLTRLAHLYEEQKEDYVAALDTTAKLFHDDLSDTGTLAELERLAKVAGAERRLAEIYSAELAKVSGDDPTTAKLAARTGQIFASLGENDQALAFYRRALAFEPESEPLFKSVDELLQRTDRHEERVSLYKAALEHKFEPAERLKLLHTIAELERRQLSRPDDAIDTYRQAVEVDDRDARSLDALTDLYRERSRWSDLADLLLRRAESADSVDIAAGHRLALARLLKNQMSEPGRAIDQLDEIVRVVPHHQEAIAELEVLKEQDPHRERIVEILRPLYEAADDWRRLIKLNEDRFGLARDAAEKVAVLRETAVLWEQRGNDKDRARRALGLAVEFDADDSDVRAEYERLAEATNAWDELAESYESALREHPDLASKPALLTTLANVHDTRRDDPRRALDAYDRLRELDASDIAPVEKMEQLATLLSDWATLDKVLTAKVELVFGDEDRASIWRRIGEGRRDMLDDRQGAITAYENASSLDPDSAFTIDCLIELYEAKSDPSRLVELYQRRVELASDDDKELKYELLVKAADVFEKKLGQRTNAIDVLNQALLVQPAAPAVLTALNRLYRAEEMWPELLDNLRLEATHADSVEGRANLRKEIAAILSSKLSSHEDALESYGLVLSERPSDAEAVAAVRKLGEDHEHLRPMAASILVPVLTDGGLDEQLVDVLEMRLTTESEPGARAATLRSIAEVLDQKLKRPAQAEAALLRAIGEQPDAADLHSEVERLAEASAGGWQRYADSLGERAQSTFDVQLARDLYTRLGKVAETKLSDDRRAVQAYTRAVEQVGDEPDLLEALDRLYARLGDGQMLADVLERRVAVVDAPSEQAVLHYRLAVLFITEFKDASRGLGSLRDALERNPDHEEALEELEALTDDRDLFEEAAEILEHAYRSRGRTDRLAALFEKRVGFAETAVDRIDMRRNLARVLEDEAKDPAAAQRVLQQGLVDDPADTALLEQIERLAGITGNWQPAASALREAIEKKLDLVPDVARDLLVRVAAWYRDRANDERAAEKALEKALEFDPESDDVLVQIEALQKGSGRERDLVQTLRRRAKLVLDDDARVALYRRAKDLADGLGDRDLAEAVLRELLSRDDTNVWALSELTRLREEQGDSKEVLTLIMRQIDLAIGDADARALRHRAALIARNKLDDPKAAVELYERLFADDPTDAVAAQALRELYAAAGSDDDLADLLDRLIDVATTPADRGTLRIELGRLRADKFGQIDRAVDIFRAVLEEEPSRGEAVVAVGELYAKGERYGDLAELLGQQVAEARARGDVDAELDYEVRLADLYDKRLDDRAKAIETYEAILGRRPQHRVALETLIRLYQVSEDHAAGARHLETLLGIEEGEAAQRVAMKLADEYRALGDLPAAGSALERGLATDPRNVTIRDVLRKLYEENGAWDKLATLIAGDADIVEPVDEKIKLLRTAAGIQATKRNDFTASADLLERASALRPGDRELMLELCDAYSSSGRGKAAVEVLEKIVQSFGGKRSKDLVEIHRRLAKAYGSDGDNARAMEELDKAFRIEPGNVNVLRELGSVSIDVGDLKRAQQMFRALLLQKLDESGPITKAEVFMNLGDVHLRLGEKQKAQQMLERAIQTDASLAKAKELLAQAKA
ncbi:MAG TPA: tetratricopeptide repeat protein [Polyangiaceae bacterium]|jgi:tetratricopeptide (TPR) repeat protein|nr:tetratricopeptide repeat protein [Polyangiaceae bacterium]